MIATTENKVVAEVANNVSLKRPIKWQCSSPADRENVANAHLIAAAPDMLEALEAIKEFTEGKIQISTPHLEAIHLSVCRVIDKAKGES